MELDDVTYVERPVASNILGLRRVGTRVMPRGKILSYRTLQPGVTIAQDRGQEV